MPFLPFAIASFVGRGARFYMVAGLMKWGGPTMEANLKKYVDRIGWATIFIVLAAFLILR